MKTVLTVVGARPQFVKAAPLSRRIRREFREVLLHTGQHYDREMSAAFFAELGIPAPDVDLGVGSGDHAPQTREMVRGILRVIGEARPERILVFGDTNSTLAGALAALRAGVPLAHVEAGLRSGNASMPEETNRIVADHLSDLCFCPTARSMGNLRGEGIGDRGRRVGDVMLDACLAAREKVRDEPLRNAGVAAGRYCFATVHRPENTDHPARLLSILAAFGRLREPVLFPVHPRTRKILRRLSAGLPANVVPLPPAGYLDTISLVSRARRVLTDSGGLQKEAWFLGVPCVTLREETEWPETLEAGRNRLAGADPDRIVACAASEPPAGEGPDLTLFGDGHAAERIVEILGRESVGVGRPADTQSMGPDGFLISPPKAPRAPDTGAGTDSGSGPGLPPGPEPSG